ncbi:hypothetical protein T265_06538 [Opisthorchis viverrini]|uniref:Uncharacterized protein n=1 Tax=Opisthorchis viverrini TaxID=6198 RepID=A0A075ADQ6_OPIVI|nr:hypothetical protein T265_06538 [Opisthorchis viverrini]KER26189.1 hypothetical protein T265_06538 [Opisthorchis viverrini]
MNSLEAEVQARVVRRKRSIRIRVTRTKGFCAKLFKVEVEDVPPAGIKLALFLEPMTEGLGLAP